MKWYHLRHPAIKPLPAPHAEDPGCLYEFRIVTNGEKFRVQHWSDKNRTWDFAMRDCENWTFVECSSREGAVRWVQDTYGSRGVERIMRPPWSPC